MVSNRFAHEPFEPVALDGCSVGFGDKQSIFEAIAFLPDTNERIPGQTPTGLYQSGDIGSAFEAERPGKFISFWQLSKLTVCGLWSAAGPILVDHHGWTYVYGTRDR